MLIEFSVENFKSIKNKATLSMVAGKVSENTENVIKDKNLLKTAVMYGANAAGKTTIIQAFTATILLIRNSNSRAITDPLPLIVPFKFDEETLTSPSKFEFTFITNNIKYIYGFSADNKKIYEEYLYQYLSAKPSMVFERNNTDEYHFVQSEDSKLKEIAEKNTPNKLFLATATNWNYDRTRDAYIWFEKQIDTYDNFLVATPNTMEKFENDINDELKDFTINLFKKTDISITDYVCEVKEINLPPHVAFALNNNIMPKENIKSKEINFFMAHTINNSNYTLNLHEESLGTQALFLLSPVLKSAFDEGRIIVVDEIDKSLHPLLVEALIKLFHDKEINKNNAQLIFNTHNTNLLDLDIFRRDQIWFVEKNNDTQDTILYSLDEFSVRKNENIEKGYLLGKFGGIPFVDEGGIL